jgi:tetratricopeptide (TPR) repeat protein
LVLIFEDLHWIDGETQGFLDVLSESVASAKLLLLTNYRPEYRHEWGQKTYYTQLRLAPLERAEAEELLTFLLGSDASLTPVKALILEKTQGTPFFMEEVVQTLVEDGTLTGVPGQYQLTQHVLTLHLPSTVQAILAARIDRLAPDEKALLQQLSVIGREFPLGLVRQVITHPEADLYRLLASLQRKEFLYEQPAFPEVEYIFKHALTQDVAYGTVLQEQRKALHERTGQAVEAIYSATLSEHYSDLAHHYRRSPSTEKAITYLHLAGQQAVQRSAHTEAISHLTTALELLLTRPETQERAVQELTLRLAVGPVLMATQGFAASTVEQNYLRARVLCAQLGDSSQRVPVLVGLWAFHLTRGELRTAQMLAEECLQLAGQTNEDGLLVEAHYAVGNTCSYRGEFVRARVALEQSVVHYQAQHQGLTPLYRGINPKVGSLIHTARVLWFLGYLEQALTRMHEALHLAQELGHPLSLAFALNFTALLHPERGDGHVAQKRVDALMALSSEHGFPLYLALRPALWGVALIAQAQWEEGIAHIQQGLEAYTGEVARTIYLAWLARGYGGAGQEDEGLVAVAEALRLVEKNDERFYEAELYRIKGELTLQSKVQGPKSQVEEEAGECFHKAVEIARKQQAKSLELCAVMSLARLWQSQSKQAEARQKLAEIYGWFTEGFDTKDLQEAQALIEELTESTL